ncbi:unnamed protein product [Hymenolepis diminuta]|uniref:Uncharacterized protein n=1 Tax=Hymenolepis diminuta TaxID=6216 RepID=A0A564ZA54_HYMDI|nr:unnamed protein product [Hymenolepis diminuta]
MIIYREMKRLGRESLKDYEMAPTWEMGFVGNEQAINGRVTCCVSLCSRELNFGHLF